MIVSRAGAQPTAQERAAAAAVLQMNAMAADRSCAGGARDRSGDARRDHGDGTGLMAAKHLFAASSIGIFEALADGPATVAEIATRAGFPNARRTSAPTPWWRWVSGISSKAITATERPRAPSSPGVPRPTCGLSCDPGTWSATRPWPNWNPCCAAAGRRSSSAHDCGKSSRAGVEALTDGPAQALAAV
jgi:hypothetical protein